MCAVASSQNTGRPLLACGQLPNTSERECARAGKRLGRFVRSASMRHFRQKLVTRATVINTIGCHQAAETKTQGQRPTASASQAASLMSKTNGSRALNCEAPSLASCQWESKKDSRLCSRRGLAGTSRWPGMSGLGLEARGTLSLSCLIGAQHSAASLGERRFGKSPKQLLDRWLLQAPSGVGKVSSMGLFAGLASWIKKLQPKTLKPKALKTGAPLPSRNEARPPKKKALKRYLAPGPLQPPKRYNRGRPPWRLAESLVAWVWVSKGLVPRAFLAFRA